MPPDRFPRIKETAAALKDHAAGEDNGAWVEHTPHRVPETAHVDAGLRSGRAHRSLSMNVT